MNDRDQPAEPCIYELTKKTTQYGDDNGFFVDHYGGFTKFEECAMRCYQTLLQDEFYSTKAPEEVADISIGHAEAFFNALEKREEKKEMDESLK